MAIRFTELPFKLTGKTYKKVTDPITGNTKYLNKFEGTMINDKLWVIGTPHLDDVNKKKDGTEYRLYQHDSFCGKFIIGLILDDYIIGSVHSEWEGMFFEFIDDENPSNAREHRTKWINDGCLFAIKIRGNNLKRLTGDFNNHLFTGDLNILSTSDDDTYEMYEQIYESFVVAPHDLKVTQRKFLNQQALYLEIVEDINEIEDSFNEFDTEQDFININEYIDDFLESIEDIQKESTTNNKGGYARGNFYHPPQKFEFIKAQLKECGFDGETIKDMIDFGKESKEQWFMFIVALGISGSYMPRFEYPFDESIKKIDEIEGIELKSILQSNHKDNISESSDLPELLPESLDEPLNESLNNNDLLKSKGFSVLRELSEIPGQIPQDFDIESAIENGDIDSTWLTIVHLLSEAVDLSNKTVKTKFKRINSDAKSIVHLTTNELIELKKQLV